jgi:hypothetical protein
VLLPLDGGCSLFLAHDVEVEKSLLETQWGKSHLLLYTVYSRVERIPSWWKITVDIPKFKPMFDLTTGLEFSYSILQQSY